MKSRLCFAIWMSCASIAVAQSRPTPPDNPAIDMQGYLAVSVAAARHRASRRLSETDFASLGRTQDTLILDARSKEKFDLLHIKGAVNLSFSDITIASLEALIPDKSTRVLIYCNNNFANAVRAFPTKRADASLNLSTYIALYSHGYRNVYELGPLLDPRTTQLEFESSSPASRQAAN